MNPFDLLDDDKSNLEPASNNKGVSRRKDRRGLGGISTNSLFTNKAPIDIAEDNPTDFKKDIEIDKASNIENYKNNNKEENNITNNNYYNKKNINQSNIIDNKSIIANKSTLSGGIDFDFGSRKRKSNIDPLFTSNTISKAEEFKKDNSFTTKENEIKSNLNTIKEDNNDEDIYVPDISQVNKY